MPIAQEDGFFQSHDSRLGSRLGIESSRLNECIERVQNNRIMGVFGSPSFGFDNSDLGFLSEIPWVENVWFWDVNLKNIDGLYALQNLRYFGVHPKRPPIDFSRLAKLREAVIEPKTKDCGIGALKDLERLHIWHFRPKNNSFSSIDFPESLTELQINWASPESLESLPSLPLLRRLEIHRCRNLQLLGDLNTKFPSLEHLVIDACGRVPRSEGERVIQDLPNLSHAYIQNIKLV
jgi:hypothetical protein